MAPTAAPTGPKVYGSIEEIEAASQGNDVEYREIKGYRPDEVFRIGSLSAGDLIEWSEANEGEAKRTAGLRLICKSLVGPAPENKRYANDDKYIQFFRARQHKTTDRIVEDILDLNGLRTKQQEAAKKD